MKNPALPALLLLVLGGAVFGVAYWLDGGESQGELATLTVPEGEDIIVPSTPLEVRRVEKLEDARDQLAHYREIGELTDHGAIKVPDVDGRWYFVKNKIVEGVGRFGEPIYGIAKYKPRPLVPLVKRRGQVEQKFHKATKKQTEKILGTGFAPRPTAEAPGNLKGSLPAGAVEGNVSGGASDDRNTKAGGKQNDG